MQIYSFKCRYTQMQIYDKCTIYTNDRNAAYTQHADTHKCLNFTRQNKQMTQGECRYTSNADTAVQM